MTTKISKCPCGDKACDQYTLSTQGSVGFDRETARRYASSDAVAKRLQAMGVDPSRAMLGLAIFLENAMRYKAAVSVPQTATDVVMGRDHMLTVVREYVRHVTREGEDP